MSAVEALREMEAAGGRVELLGDGRLHIEAPEPLPDDLVDRIRANKPEIVAMLAGHADKRGAWDAETARLIEWFMRTPPPRRPIELCKGVVIANPALWWTALMRDIADGPGGPRACCGAMQADLKRLAAYSQGSISIELGRVLINEN